MKPYARQRHLILLLICILPISVIWAGTPSANIEAGNHLWQQRDDFAVLNQCIETYTAVLATDPHNPLLLTRLAIAYYWKGNSLPKGLWHRKERMQAYQTGKQYAAQLCAINPESIEGNFWHAVNDVCYINEMLIKTSKSIIDDAVRRNNLVMQKDKYYYHGGPLRLAAKIIWGMPSFVREKDETLENAEAMLQEATTHDPNFSLSYIFLSDIYMAMGKEALAKKALLQTLTINENSLPQFAPEIRRDKHDANLRLKEHFGS